MKLYIELIHDDGEIGVFEDYFVTCEDCRFFRKNFRLHYMSPGADESPHACIHKNGLLHPWEDDWCSYGKGKDHE